MKNKTLMIFGLAQFLIIIGAYILLLLNSLVGEIILGFGIILILYCILFKNKELKSDEMLRKIDGASSSFAFIITGITLVLLAIGSAYYIDFVSVKLILLILLTILILSKILYQSYWFWNNFRK